jgi:organic radical activating enzyme
MVEQVFQIHETFQQTVQGEGLHAGRYVDFIRLSGCPVGCSWCDTGYADGGATTPRKSMTLSELIGELSNAETVVISGGEPFIHRNLSALCEGLIEAGKAVHIETSGGFLSKSSIPGQVWVTLSPKEHMNKSYPVQLWLRADEVKFVIEKEEDILFYARDEKTFRGGVLKWLFDSGIPVFFQPAWTDTFDVSPYQSGSFDVTLEALKVWPKARLSLQTHKLIGVK